MTPKPHSANAELFIKSNHRLGESILWHEARQCLYWIDLLDPALFSHDPATRKTTRRTLDLRAPIGSIVATTDPDLFVISHRDGLSFLHIDRLTLMPFANPEAGRDAVIYNDMKCDRWGRLWLGTSHMKELDPRGALWCLETKSRYALVDVGFPVSNGPAFSPDGRFMYFNDSVNYQTLVYDISPENLMARNRRVLARYARDEGMPDGLTVDEEGNIWTAQWAGSAIVKLSPTGDKLATHAVPAGHVTSLCFAGPQRNTLYITTASDGLSEEALARLPLTGSLFTLATNARGLPEPLFRLTG